jgi:hypothetical protein
MLVRLRGLLGEFELHPRTLASAGLEPLSLDRWQITRMLHSALADQPSYRLRSLLDDSEDPDCYLDEFSLVDRLADRIARGDLILVREVHLWTSPSTVEEEEEQEEPEDVIERLEWIEVVVADEDDQPVANVAYKLVLADGSSRTGKTNSLGIVRYDRIPAGSCTFELTELDASAWKQA